MAGYHGQPEKTAEAIDEGWFYTGDYGTVDEDGIVYFIDRRKDIVRRGGENISSYEVEGVIKALDEPDEVTVIPSPDEFYTEVVKVLARVKEGQTLSPEGTIDHCQRQIATFKIPRYIEFVDEFPYTPTGEIQKQLLCDRKQTGEPDH